MDKQRIYDAMLIKAFRSDVLMGTLNYWLKVYDIDLIRDKHLYKRIPEYLYMGKRVQEMVGDYMKPLANRLWDTERKDDIKTLDWMQRVECIKRKEVKPKNEETTKENRDRLNLQRMNKLVVENIRAEKRSNQWSVTKGKPTSRYGRRTK
jgi:hypothetical protein